MSSNSAIIVNDNNRILASALLLNNPIVIESDGVIPHPDQPQEKSTRLVSDKQPTAQVSLEKQNYLSLQTMQMMIERFLTEKHIPIEQLAKNLGIDTIKLKRFSVVTYKNVAAKICLPLIKLYCKTKWA